MPDAVASPSSATASVRALRQVHRSGESGSPGPSVRPGHQGRAAASGRAGRPLPPPPACRVRFGGNGVAVASSRRPRRTVGGSRRAGDEGGAAIPERAGFSCRPEPTRTLREHRRQRGMLRPEIGQRHASTAALVRKKYKLTLSSYFLTGPLTSTCAACRPRPLWSGHAATPQHQSINRLFEAQRWMANLRILEINKIKTVPHVPLSHPFVET